MNVLKTSSVFLWLIVSISCYAESSLGCEVRAQTEYGSVCGTLRTADDGSTYASFRGVPYAKQPLGELRFKELQPAEPWDGDFNATTDGPICPQDDVFFSTLMKPQGKSESCIHANIHVPINALAGEGQCKDETQGLPVIVQVHGGNFQHGSGDADFNGPEYLVSKGVVIITFNFRLNALGFLSLNTSKIPGNNGLRDIVTLLKWVKRNAVNFGGNPDDVTLAGNSLGGACAHLVSLSGEADGLFNRLILMSGTSGFSYFSVTQTYSKSMADQYLAALVINSTDSDEIYNELIAMDIEQLSAANKKLQDQKGFDVFAPVIESKFEGVTRMLEDDPKILMQRGRGKDVPILVGFTNNEPETFKKGYEKIDIVPKLAVVDYILTSPRLYYSLSSNASSVMARDVKRRYTSTGNFTGIDEFMKYQEEAFFARQVIKFAQWRAVLDHAPTYLYQFSYNSPTSPVKQVYDIQYEGTAQLEDYTYLYKTNSLLSENDKATPPKNEDDKMKHWYQEIFTNFTKCSNPTCDAANANWPAVEADVLKYQDIRTPGQYSFVDITSEQFDVYNFLDRYEPEPVNPKS